MANTFTLDDIRKAAEAKYGATEVDLGDGQESVRLVNVLRLPKEKRDRLIAAQKQLQDDEADQEAILRDMLRLVAETDAQASRLLDVIGDDLAVLLTVFTQYSEGTQLGEASASQD